MIKGSIFFCTIGLFPLQLWAKRWCSVSAVLCGSVHFYTANQKRGGVSNWLLSLRSYPTLLGERRAFPSLYKAVFMSVLFQSVFFLYFLMSLWVKLWIGKFMCSIYVLFTNIVYKSCWWREGMKDVMKVCVCETKRLEKKRPIRVVFQKCYILACVYVATWKRRKYSAKFKADSKLGESH